MEYASFYGGRKGSSFVIVKNYLDIPSMINDFSRGGAFTEVNYDEYVIINTINKNHPDNGKIFRRGYDYNSSRTIDAYRAYDANENEIINGTAQQYKNAIYQYDDSVIAGGAIYVGTIVGPAGRGPHLTMTTYDLAENKQAGQGFENRKSSGEYDINNSSLIPGKYLDENEEIQYNDAIQWYVTSVRDSYNEDTQAYIGFKIPYPVIEYTTTVVDPYNENGQYADMSAATRLDDTEHPFYEKWNFSIPHGIKGDTLKNFRVIVPQEGDLIYSLNPSSNPDEESSSDEEPNSDEEIEVDTIYPGFQDDVEYERSILVYDYYNYDDIENPQKKTYYIGDYNQITDFTIEEDGTITIAFSHNNTITYDKLIKWIDNITLNQDEQGEIQLGHFIITYNTGDVETYDFDWVRDIRFEQDEQGNYDGTVFIDYTVSNTVQYPKLIKWINDISLASENIESQVQGEPEVVQGTFRINYNDGTDLIEYLKWVNNITLSNKGQLILHYSGNGSDKVISSAEDNNFIKWINDIALSNSGTLTITYNTGIESIQYDEQTGQEISSTWEPDTTVFPNAVRWVTNVDFDGDGNIIVNYNTGSSDIYENQIKWIQDVNLNTQTGVFTISYNQTNIPDYSVRLKWPTNIDIATKASSTAREGTGSQKIKVSYTTGEINEIGNPLNYIMQTRITSDGHLIVLYADPSIRQALMDTAQAYYFDSINQWTDPISGYSGWLDLGSVYTDSGILIGLNLNINDIPTEEEVPTQEDIIAFLNEQYHEGLTGSKVSGKIVTVGQSGGDKYFYGFDYNYIDGTNTFKGWYYLGTFSNVSAILTLQNEVPPNLQQDTLCFLIEETYSVTYNLTNTESTNLQTVIEAGGTYTTRLTGVISNISVTMGQQDITDSVYNDTTSTIVIGPPSSVTSVTGDIIITAVGIS